jgi:hypothetical protein
MLLHGCYMSHAIQARDALTSKAAVYTAMVGMVDIRLHISGTCDAERCPPGTTVSSYRVICVKSAPPKAALALRRTHLQTALHVVRLDALGFLTARGYHVLLRVPHKRLNLSPRR